MKFMMNFTIEFQIQILNIFYQNILMEAFLLVIQNTILEEHHDLFYRLTGLHRDDQFDKLSKHANRGKICR